MWNGNWTPPLGYKGLRTGYRHACRIKLHRESAGYNRLNIYDWTDERLEWCEENCKNPWSHVDGAWWFDKTNEAIMFKMVFGGQ